jgi:RNA polymerase sigma-70 factor (ECF subfamily)
VTLAVFGALPAVRVVAAWGRAVLSGAHDDRDSVTCQPIRPFAAEVRRIADSVNDAVDVSVFAFVCSTGTMQASLGAVKGGVVGQTAQPPVGPLAADVAAGDVDDAVLVLAAQADPDAFGTLYRRYRDRVYRYLRLRVSSDDEAADLTQQVFLNALTALPRYRERGAPFAAWLFRIAHNLAANAQRGRGRTIAWERLSGIALESSADDPEAVVLRRERLARLQALFDELDAGKQELLALRFGAGLSAREIAPVVGKREAAVKKQLTRTIQTLRERCGDA